MKLEQDICIHEGVGSRATGLGQCFVGAPQAVSMAVVETVLKRIIRVVGVTFVHTGVVVARGQVVFKCPGKG